jgi:hypothetical protein
LAVRWIVWQILTENLSQTLREASLELSRCDRLVEDTAGILNRGVVDDAYFSGLGVKLNLGYLATVRESRGRFGNQVGVE